MADLGTSVFFDPSGKRGVIAKRVVAVVLVLLIAAVAAFATTLVAMPRVVELPLPIEHPRGESLKAQINRLDRTVSSYRHLFSQLSHPTHAKPLTVGFYIPGDQTSIQSLKHNLGTLDWVVPASITVSGPAYRIKVSHDPRLAQVIANTPRAPQILPMVQNLADGRWDGAGTARLFRNADARRRVITHLVDEMKKSRTAGLVIDFENMPASALPPYARFLAQLHRAMPAGKILCLTVPAGDESWPPRLFAPVADKIILMDYDHHWQGGTPGPIAEQDWFTQESAQMLKAIGPDKLIVALGSYAYDWHDHRADALTIDEAWLAAHDSEAPVTFDPASSNSAFAYDEAGSHHEIWMLDAAASWNEMVALHRLGIGQLALWRLGSEDDGFWAALHAFRHGGKPDLKPIPRPKNVDVEGNGEVLRISDTSSAGSRLLDFGKNSLIRNERYVHLPTPLVVQRTGARDKLVALTFDDGPDPVWTPQILSILEKAHVPATFFVIGENALQHPMLLKRIYADGDELGNHTYTHPNLALDSKESTRLELNSTQRLVEAYTGHAMRLFRAPYFGDAEPTTSDEIDPALVAQQQGYVVVGLHVDPADWRTPGVDAIVNRTIEQVTHPTAERSANVVLLHDAGGNRAQTAAALPRIIAGLQARGYRLVPVSTLIGLPRAAVMPAVKDGDLLAVRIDVAIFILIAAAMAVLSWLFFAAISIGMARAILMTVLAAVQTSRRRADPPDYHPSVTVIIPAYNEERVIEASLRRVLASDYPELSVIVADDGSKDRTSIMVAEAFADDPRVTLLTLANGGKAVALNRALTHAKGEIIIALDADTQFEPLTITRLVRWFADPAIGAVAGDARVGNRVNLVTRWQAVEYITAQNLERRALAGFDAMTVVPGAVGAWRRAALEQVGGYPEDTLAEDQDLTIAIQRAGWRVTYDPRAVAWTEAPESFAALAKQRFRWAFGTLQCLWKHRAILKHRQPAGLALIGLPQAWLFQIGFAAISPLIDLTLIVSVLGTTLHVYNHGWAQTESDVLRMGAYWLAFTLVDVICGWIAYRLDGHRTRFPAHLLIAQRIIYRQIMYWVVLKAISSAIVGWRVGWGKLDRTGHVTTSPSDIGGRQQNRGNQTGMIVSQQQLPAVKTGDDLDQRESKSGAGLAA